MLKCIRMTLGLFLMVSLAFAQTPSNTEPALGELKTLQFSADPKLSANEALLHSQIRANASLLKAYEEGLKAVRTYREPILTRGARGVALFKAASPAVALIVVGKVSKGEFQPSGLGTGVFFDARGYVLTNWHVVHRVSSAAVFMKPDFGADPQKANVYVGDVVLENATKDLAVLKINDPPPSIPILSVGDIHKADVAEDIHIIGHPHGEFWSYTTGVISQIRDDYAWKYEDGSEHHAKVIQLQTAINPGNSGGPVLNDSGEMIGLVAMSEGGQNLDYAIAADEIQQFIGGLPVATRGGHHPIAAPPTPSESLSILAARTQSGWSVTKSDDNGITTYVLSKGGQPVSALVMVGYGLRIRADNFSPEGFFAKYSASTIDGKSFSAAATQTGLSSFSSP